MNWFRNLKIQNKLWLAFGVLVSLLIFISVFSSVQLHNVNKRYHDLIDSAFTRQNSLSMVIADMDKMYYLNLAKGYQVIVDPDSEKIAALQESHHTYTGLFEAHLHDYRSSLSADKNLSEAEKRQRLAILDEAEVFFIEEYQPKT